MPVKAGKKKLRVFYATVASSSQFITSGTLLGPARSLHHIDSESLLNDAIIRQTADEKCYAL